MSDPIRYHVPTPVIVILLIFTVMCGMASVSFAAEDRGVSVILQPIHKVPAAATGDMDIQAAIEKAFDGQGRIDRIGEARVIINDQIHMLSGPNVSSGFHAGQYVGFVKNDAGEIVRMEPLTPPKK